jgi:hypothetical protein
MFLVSSLLTFTTLLILLVQPLRNICGPFGAILPFALSYGSLFSRTRLCRASMRNITTDLARLFFD